MLGLFAVIASACYLDDHTTKSGLEPLNGNYTLGNISDGALFVLLI